ncbi:MAG: branched-chain amino acid ABC transporter permease [Betaproteobacteria bacterium]|nr:branched-chain amino acid ABC transporter permease [Betaproteobacteria bacterium]NBT74889.1 branched-chain amino acid ABC transporter permease [Betaproteobacteria bacterium]NCA15487.1 branched-chain amino acid ABC transporter permease [Betaproteobacteria bacterium]
MTSANLQYVLSGLAVGAIYSLIGLGFSIMWSASRAANFAHGDVVMLGAVLGVVFVGLGWSLTAALPVVVLVCVVYGVLVERFAVRPFAKEATGIGWMLSTIGVGIMLESYVTISFGSFAKPLPSPLIERPITVLGAGIYPQELLIPVFAISFLLGLEYFYRHTMVGRAIRATAFNPVTAGLMGINVKRMTAISFGISAALGGSAGLLIAPITQASATMGLLLGLKGFAVAIIAGITQARGVLVMGLVYGILEKFIEGYISSAAREAIGFAIIILLLFAFPQGIFGKREMVKV